MVCCVPGRLIKRGGLRHSVFQTLRLPAHFSERRTVNREVNYNRWVREVPYESEEISRCLMRTTFSRKL